MEVAGQVLSYPGLIALGVIVGLVAGMFGVGGGFLLTPLLSVVFGVPMPIAVGTGLCQMVGSSTSAALRHRKMGQGEPRFAIVMIVGSLAGVSAGARAIAELNESLPSGRGQIDVTAVLYGAYVFFLLCIAGVLWWQGRGGFEDLEYVRRGPLSRWRLPPYIDLLSIPMPQVSVMGIAYLGLFLGCLSGFLGTSGGIALIPILLYGYGFPFRQAAGTGIVVTWLTAVVGTLAHYADGNVHVGLAMVLMVGSSLSAQVGAELTRSVSATRLRKGLAAIVFTMALVIVGELVNRLQG